MEKPKVDTSSIPDYALESLARAALEAIRRDCADPENVKKLLERKKDGDSSKT